MAERSIDSTSSSQPSSAVDQSIAGSLPPELLTIIFKHVEQQNKEAAQQQRDRLNQSRVCLCWHAARFKPNEYHVQGGAAALLHRTFSSNPVRAAQALKLTIDGRSDLWRDLLELSPNLTELSVTNKNDLAPDALSSLPASLRTLRLNLKSFGNHDWLPDFTAVPAQTAIEFEGTWDSTLSPDTLRVVDAIAPALSQFTHFALVDLGAHEAIAPWHFLDAPLAQMTCLTHLKLNMGQVDPDVLASLVGRLRALEEVRMMDVERCFVCFVKAPLVRDIIAQAPPKLKLLVIDEGLIDLRPEREDELWDVDAMAKLKVAARERGIRLMFVDWTGTDKRDNQQQL